MNSFPERPKAERKRLKLSQNAFAALAGLKKQAQIHYEKGERSPNADYLMSLAAAGVDIHYLLTGAKTTPASFKLEKETGATATQEMAEKSACYANLEPTKITWNSVPSSDLKLGTGKGQDSLPNTPTTLSVVDNALTGNLLH
ncbi:MAG: helix-turn-helix transcriptional regulator [Exilibacterium sp.]